MTGFALLDQALPARALPGPRARAGRGGRRALRAENRFYARDDEPELRERLSVPANVLDNYIPYRW
ncbi:hypothetical protein AB0C21_00005, partial [Spirillospora sp. NPDC049024]